MKRFPSLGALALTLALVAACSGARVVPQTTYEQTALSVRPQELRISRGKLELKFTFVNHSEKVMFVDRDQMSVRLADGSTRSRYKGTWAGMGNGTHTIPP